MFGEIEVFAWHSLFCFFLFCFFLNFFNDPSLHVFYLYLPMANLMRSYKDASLVVTKAH